MGAAPVMVAARPLRGARTEFLRATVSSTEGRVAAGLLLVMAALIVFGPLVTPYSPTRTGVGPPLQSPSLEHLLGTDSLGRDVASRVLSGGRDVVWLPLLGILLAFSFGGLLAVVAGYRRGWVDVVFTRITDLGLALPPILLVLLIIAVAGGSSLVLVLGVATVFAPRIARVVRGATQVVASQEFVEIARTRGESATSIALREILPNISGALAVEFALRLTHAIVFVAALNFLGVGAQPPSPNWGLMVSEGRSVLSQVPLVALAPAAAIAALAIALNMLVDAASRALARDSDAGKGVFR